MKNSHHLSFKYPRTQKEYLNHLDAQLRSRFYFHYETSKEPLFLQLITLLNNVSPQSGMQPRSADSPIPNSSYLFSLFLSYMVNTQYIIEVGVVAVFSTLSCIYHPLNAINAATVTKQEGIEDEEGMGMGT